MSEVVLGPKSAKYRVFCGYTWKTPVYLENTWVSCRFPQFCPRFCPRPALRLRETREFPEGNSRETEWSTKHPLVSLWVAGNPRTGQSALCPGRRHLHAAERASDSAGSGRHLAADLLGPRQLGSAAAARPARAGRRVDGRLHTHRPGPACLAARRAVADAAHASRA